jgi:hypothetical protein
MMFSFFRCHCHCFDVRHARKLNVNVPSSERGSHAPQNIETPQSGDDTDEVEDRLKGFSLALKERSAWSSKSASVIESPLCQQLKAWRESEEEGHLQISPKESGKCHALCCCIVGSQQTWSLCKNKLIGRAFGVAEGRVVSIHTDKMEPLPISHQKTVKEPSYNFSMARIVSLVTDVVDTLCFRGRDPMQELSGCGQPSNSHGSSVQTMLFSQVPSCLFQAPHFGLNVQTTNSTQAVASSLFQNAPTTSSASASPQPQAVFIENEPDLMTQNC